MSDLQVLAAAEKLYPFVPHDGGKAIELRQAYVRGYEAAAMNGGYWEHDEVLFDNGEDEYLVPARRWVSDWTPVPGADLYQPGDPAPGTNRSTLGVLDPLIGTPKPQRGSSSTEEP